MFFRLLLWVGDQLNSEEIQLWLTQIFSFKKKSAFERKNLLEKDIIFKQKFYYTKSAHYETATLKTINLIPSATILPSLKSDYIAMKNMFYGESPDFNDILTYLKQLESEIHNL